MRLKTLLTALVSKPNRKAGGKSPVSLFSYLCRFYSRNHRSAPSTPIAEEFTTMPSKPPLKLRYA